MIYVMEYKAVPFRKVHWLEEADVHEHSSVEVQIILPENKEFC